MKGYLMRNQFRALAGFLVSCTLLVQTAAMADPNVDIMKNLYVKIGTTVGVGSNDPQVGGSFLVLANPGILLDPTLDFNSIEGRYTLSKVLDKTLKADWIYKTGNDGTFDVYNNILNYHEAAMVKPTATQRSQYLTACRLIFTDCDQPQPGNYSDGYKTYKDLTTKLATASGAAELYLKTSNASSLPADLQSDLQLATTDLDLLGNRVAIEAALSTINTFEHIDPNAWWGQLRGRFSKNSLPHSGSQYGNYLLYPSYPVWLDMNRSWSKLALSQSDLTQSTNNSSSSVGGGVSGGWGLWSFGADYSHQENRTYFDLDASGMNVSMELMRVVLDRPWMDDAVYTSHAWKWLKASPYDKKLISDGGDTSAGTTPTGIMPFVPTGLLLARRVSLSGNWSHDLKTTFDSNTSSGASIGWGPFSFGGRYNASDASTYTKANAAGNTVQWDAPQIIGFFVEVLPRNPDPDRCYKFASDATGLPADCTVTNFLTPFSFTPQFTARRTTSRELLNRAHDILERTKAKRS